MCYIVRMARYRINSVGLRTALLVYIMLPMALALGIFGYLALNFVETIVEKQMQKDLELVARAVRQPLSYALEKERMGSMQQSLQSVFSIGRVYSAYVYDNTGKNILNLGEKTSIPEPDKLNELTADGKKQGKYEQIAGRQVYSYFLPLTDSNGNMNGILQLTRKKSEFIENFHRLRINAVLLLSLLMLMLSGLVLYGHHRAIGEHLKQLTSSMARVAGGDRSHRFKRSGPREIVLMGQNFNTMLNSIDAAQKTIMEQRKKQNELEKQLRQNEKLAALGRFAAGTAHELGTPLSTIGGRAQRAQRDRHLPSDLQQVFSTIRHEVGRMEYIIKQLLDFSRQNPLRCKPIHPSHLSESALSSVRKIAQNNQTVIHQTPSDQKTLVMMDVIKVQQALTNLLKNAIQSTPEGNVRLTWQLDSDELVFCVDDDGPGVPLENRSRIFEPFYTTKTVGNGTGLGLSIVHAVAEDHDGRIEVKNSSMGGACFRLHLSLQACPETLLLVKKG